MSGQSSQVGRDFEQDAKFPAPNLAHLDRLRCPRRRLTGRHSFQTSPTRAAPSKVRRTVFVRNGASTPTPAGERSFPRGQELGGTGLRFLSVERELYQPSPHRHQSAAPAFPDNKDLNLAS